MKKSKSESEIQKEILYYLQALGFFAWRNHTQGVIGPNGRRIPNPSKGSPDIMAILDPQGQFLGIEVKKPGGKTSKEQKEWITKARKRGAICIIAHSVDEVKQQLKNYDLIYHR